jgi:arylsulfatase A-like enzyme
MSKELIPKKETGYDEYFRDQRNKLPGACVDFIQKKRNKPFFAVASFINPHDICFAYNAYKKREKMMAGVNELYEQASRIPLEDLPPLPSNFEIPKHEPDAIAANGNTTAVTPRKTMRAEYDEREWRMYRWIYCRLTEEVDGHIGQILDGLKASGQEENTLVVFLSDHGDMDASHGLASKGVFYEESACVPLIMRHPKSIQGGKVSQVLVNIGLDVLPTFCDYAGIKAPEHLLGQSLRTIDKFRPYIASENHWTRMIRTTRYKYCAYKEGENRESLVDLENDPGEMKNLALDKRYEAALNHHRQYLADWVKLSADDHGKEYLVASLT